MLRRLGPGPAGRARGEARAGHGRFTRYGERADEWIVRWITTRPEAVVVTSDRAVGQAARRRAAAVIGAAAFAARLDGTAIADDPDTAADADAVPDRREPRPRRRLGRRANWLRRL